MCISARVHGYVGGRVSVHECTSPRVHMYVGGHVSDMSARVHVRMCM